MKTYEEAKAAAIAAGIPEGNLTAETIKFYGHEVGNPVEHFTPRVVVDRKTLDEDIALAEKEAAGNQLLTNIIGTLGKLSKKAISSGILPITLLFCLVFTSGCRTTAAQKLNKDIEESVRANNEQHLQFEEGFIQDFRQKEFARIDELYESAVKSQTQPMTVQVTEPIKTRTFAADGKVTEGTELVTRNVIQNFIRPETAAALMKHKQDLYAQVELNTISWRKKQATISQNAANAARASAALQAYFEQKAVNFEQMNQLSNTFLDFMDKFLNKKKTDPKADLQFVNP